MYLCPKIVEIFKKYIYYDFFLISIIIQIGVLLFLTIHFYTSRYQYIWFNSKILTINNIIEENYNNYKIYLDFNSYYYYTALNFSYYDLLKNSSKDKCAENLKQCGILDTYGNKLCLYKDYPCPVNEMIVDFTHESKKYIEKGYKYVNYRLLRFVSGYTLYFSNTSYDKNIISSLIYAEFTPRLIDSHNFIFDTNAYEIKYDYKKANSYENKNQNIANKTNQTYVQNLLKTEILDFTKILKGEEEIDLWYEDKETNSKLEQTPKLKDYINSQLNKNNEEDKNYIKIFDNIFFKNFIGFDNAEEMDTSKNTDFTIYKNIFPDNSKIFLIMFFEILLFFFSLFYMRKLYEDEVEGENNDCKRNEIYILLCGMSIYSLSFIIILIFFIKYGFNLLKLGKYYKLKKLKCDNIIKDFINEFIDNMLEKRIIIIILLLFWLISLIFYILTIYYYLKKLYEDYFRNDIKIEPIDIEPNDKIYNNYIENSNIITNKTKTKNIKKGISESNIKIKKYIERENNATNNTYNTNNNIENKDTESKNKDNIIDIKIIPLNTNDLNIITKDKLNVNRDDNNKKIKDNDENYENQKKFFYSNNLNSYNDKSSEKRFGNKRKHSIKNKNKNVEKINICLIY